MLPHLARPVRLTLGLALAALLALPAAAFDTRATAAFVLDQKTGTVLLSKNADQPLPPASMSKLMTIYMALEAIRDGRLRWDEELRTSEHAASYGGSTLFLRPGERVSVRDLVRGVIVLSGNDASAVLAEALSPDGTERGFANAMTQRAQQLGMTNSTFANSNGWPAEGHRMSMRDLVLLANRLITDFPEEYRMFAEEEFLFDEEESANRRNRNPILGIAGLGADGLKTGHTQEAGYGLVGSGRQGERRIIFALTGLDSEKARAEEAESILNWGYRQFAEYEVGKQGERVAEADVWMGMQERVGLVLTRDLTLLLPATSAGKVPGEVIYSTPLQAPIAAGTEVGTLILRPEGLPEIELPLAADSAVAKGGFTQRVTTVAQLVVKRFLAGPDEAAPAETPAPDAEAGS